MAEYAIRILVELGTRERRGSEAGGGEGRPCRGVPTCRKVGLFFLLGPVDPGGISAEQLEDDGTTWRTQSWFMGSIGRLPRVRRRRRCGC